MNNGTMDGGEPFGDGVADWLQRNWHEQPETFQVEVEGAAIACRGWNLGAKHLGLIVLAHGFHAHARWWDHIAPALALHHRVVAFDFSGMGDSAHRPAYSRAQYGREILAVAASQGAQRPIIIAHSFGGLCAGLAARAHPDKMQRLIVIDSAFQSPPQTKRAIDIRPLRYFPDVETAVSRFRLLPSGEWPNPLVLYYIAWHSVVQAEEGWRWKFDHESPISLNTEDYLEDMVGITVPVDMIYGDETEIMTPSCRAALRAMAHDVGQDIVVHASHHHILIEQPIALVAALNALLANPRGCPEPGA